MVQYTNQKPERRREMKQLISGFFALVVALTSATAIFAVGSDFSKEEVAAAGKHCVHGFWVNEQTVRFYAGDTALLNDDLSRWLEGQYASRKVVIHSGTTRASPASGNNPTGEPEKNKARSVGGHKLRPVTPKGSRCTFATFGGKAPVSVEYHRGEGADAAKGRLYCFDQPHCRCQVRYVDLPDSARGLSRLQIATKYGFTTWSEPGKLKTIGTVKAGDREGEAFIVTGLSTRAATPDAGKPYEVRVRVFIVKSRVYFVSSAFDRENLLDAEPEAKAFLDSFRIEGK
jgi:hypothetical protein